MAARLKLTIDWFNKKLVRSNKSASPFTLPAFFQGDVVPMQVQIVEPDPNGGPNDFIIPDNSSMTLKMAVSATPIGTSGSPTPYVTQFSWSKDTNERYFYADVAFNTSELNTEIGSDSSITGYLEFEISEDSAITTVWQGTITIKAQVIETGTLTVAAGQTPLSLEDALQRFAAKVMADGETLTFKSPDGNKVRILGVNNDGSGMDDVI